MQTESETSIAQNARPLATQPLGRLMRRYAVPCMTSLVVAALYNMVDQVFIANAPDLGSVGNAATTVVFPLTVAALAIAVMLGDGCCAFVSISLGADRREDAHRGVGNAVVLSAAGGIVLCILYLIFSDEFIAMFGGTVNEKTFAFAKEYFFWIALGIPVYVFGQAMNPVIRSDGSPRFAMVSTVAGAVVNIILDPIFIFVFKWGMMGAAVATVLGQLLTAVMAVYYLFHMRSVKLEKASFRLCGSVIKRFIPLGICSFLAQISLVAAMAATNNMIRKYGALDPVFGLAEYAQIPMAVVGIVMKFFQIIMSVCIGMAASMAAGCIPIVGYNMGAEKYGRVRGLFTRLLICEAAAGAIATLIVELFPTGLIAIFGAANESAYYTEFAVKCFRIYLCMMPLACVNKAAFIFLQAMGKAVASTALSMIREIVFGVGLVLVLPLVCGLDGVIISMPAADILAFIASAIVIIYTYRTLKKDESKRLA